MSIVSVRGSLDGEEQPALAMRFEVEARGGDAANGDDAGAVVGGEAGAAYLSLSVRHCSDRYAE